MELSPVARKTLLLCGWCGPLAIIISLIGWLVAGLLPFPLGPGNTAEEVARFYAGGTHVTMGIVISSVSLGLVIPLVAGITFVMWRTESKAPVLTFVQLVSGTVTCVCLLLPMLIMATAGFRSDRSPELTVLLNDLSWLMFITPIAPFIIQNLAIAVAALNGEGSLFPRWIGFLNLWVGFSFTFDILAFAFRSGPLAWNGFLIFWLALTTYSIWLICMGLTLRSLALNASDSTQQVYAHDRY
ncbi:hypothetical protein N5O88_09510 [Pseudomonas sp. GD03721]|nr:MULTISPECIES: hypothetical protein [unclassified Pseudomonas]MDH1440501.1 hypothetical protein [Pseudomonas sp. GD03722]WGG03412.1 hypothetical protein N5O88_09510 [Pseudomonas sp. GD03721]WGG07580.1 hypothetical protein N5O87_09520 [Pseudomonas sp. GD03919]